MKPNETEFPDLPWLRAMSLSDAEFAEIRDLVYEKFGINLTDRKRGLVIGRLQKLLREKGFESFAEYVRYVKGEGGAAALSELVNRISTNHTFFYREKDHFEYFKDVVLPEIAPRLIADRSYDLRVWCAGCSSGEEPYTLAMLLLEHFGPEYPKWKAGILATDISAEALDIAHKGVYPKERVANVPPTLLAKYFTPTADGRYAIDARVKREVIFRRFNLMEKQFPFKKTFHAIFCRNVMIYFDAVTRDALVERFYHFTDHGGYLFIGHSETLGRDKCRFHYVKPAVYKKM